MRDAEQAIYSKDFLNLVHDEYEFTESVLIVFLSVSSPSFKPNSVASGLQSRSWIRLTVSPCFLCLLILDQSQRMLESNSNDLEQRNRKKVAVHTPIPSAALFESTGSYDSRTA